MARGASSARSACPPSRCRSRRRSSSSACRATSSSCSPTLRTRPSPSSIAARTATTASSSRSPAGVDFSSLDGKPTHLFFLLVAPEDSAGTHLKALARISRLLKDAGFRAHLMQAADARELYRIIREEDDKY